MADGDTRQLGFDLFDDSPASAPAAPNLTGAAPSPPPPVPVPEPAAEDTVPPLAPGIIVLDLETQKTFDEVGGRNQTSKLGLAVGVTYNSTTQTYRAYTEWEVADLLRELRAAELVVGYNLKGFDYKVLERYTLDSLDGLPTCDMLEVIAGLLGYRVSLDSVARATLNANKSGDGLKAVQWYREGKLEQVKVYCQDDVAITRDVFAYGRREGHIYYLDRITGVKKKLELSW